VRYQAYPSYDVGTALHDTSTVMCDAVTMQYDHFTAMYYVVRFLVRSPVRPSYDAGVDPTGDIVRCSGGALQQQQQRSEKMKYDYNGSNTTMLDTCICAVAHSSQHRDTFSHIGTIGAGLMPSPPTVLSLVMVVPCLSHSRRNNCTFGRAMAVLVQIWQGPNSVRF
jgi:hypothetical protein